MLKKLITVIGGEDIDFEEARLAFFTRDSGEEFYYNSKKYWVLYKLDTISFFD